MGLEITLAGDVTIRRTGATDAAGAGASGGSDGAGDPGNTGDSGGDEPLRLRSAQARVAFALLTLERRRGVTRDSLAEAVWPEGLPNTWESALRTVVSRVRAFVTATETSGREGGDPLVSHGGRYLLHLPDDVVVDLEQAEAQLESAQEAVAAGRVEEGRDLAQRAVDRLRAPFLPDHDGDWVAGRREHFEGRLITALELLSQAASALGDHPTALVAANDAVATSPLRESAHRCRMAAHVAAGNRGEALRAYQLLRTMLAEELGVDPDSETESAYLSLLGPAPAASTAAGSPGAEGALLTAASAAASGLRSGALSGPAAPFVGRDGDLAVVLRAWAAARAGTPRLVLVSGEAGCGKTRLAVEAARRIGEDGALVLLGRCDPSLGTPYQPLVELLDGFLYALPRDWTQEFRPMVRAALATVFPAVAGLDDVSPPARPTAHDRAELFDAVTEILVDAAGDRPILVVLDDAQAADEDSLALLRHLVRHVGDAPLLVLAMASSRLAFDHPFADTIRTLERDGLVERLNLGGLTEADVRGLLQQLRPDDPVDTRTRLARSLVADTSGNPLMLVELLRDLDAGAGARAGTGVRAGVPVVPLGVQDLVERKLDGLGDAAHDLLRVAAVAASGAGGAEFDLDVVEQAVGLDHVAVLDALDQVLDSALVAESGTGARYRFTQEVTRRTVYDRLSEPRRRHLHEQVADAVEARRADRLDDHVAVLARHRAAAAGPGGDRRAVEWARRAADRARTEHAPSEVVRLHEDALAHVPADDVVLYAEVLTDLGLALVGTDGERAEGVLLDAALQAQRCGRPDLAARAALGLADLARNRPALRADAAALVEDLLADLSSSGAAAGPPAGTAGTAGMAGMATARLLARHVELGGVGVDVGGDVPPGSDNRLGDDLRALVPAAVTTLVGRLDELAGPGDDDERMALAADLATLGAFAGDGRASAVAAHHRAMAAAVMGDWKTVDQVLDAAGNPTMRAWRAVVVAVARGDFDRTAEVLDGPDDLPTRRQLLVARWLQGTLGGHPDDDRPRDPTDALLVALARGRRGQARLAMHALASGADPLPGGDARLHSLGVLALAAVELGDAATADAVRGHLAPHADLWCGDGYRSFVGTVGFHLGRLAAVSGDLADAERYLMPALSQHAEMQARPWVALTQHALADVLDARGRSSDRDWVNALRSEVRWLATDLGLRPL